MFGYTIIKSKSLQDLLDIVKEFHSHLDKEKAFWLKHKVESEALDKLSKKNISGEITWQEYVHEFNIITNNEIEEAVNEEKKLVNTSSKESGSQ